MCHHSSIAIPLIPHTDLHRRRRVHPAPRPPHPPSCSPHLQKQVSRVPVSMGHNFATACYRCSSAVAVAATTCTLTHPCRWSQAFRSLHQSPRPSSRSPHLPLQVSKGRVQIVYPPNRSHPTSRSSTHPHRPPPASAAAVGQQPRRRRGPIQASRQASACQPPAVATACRPAPGIGRRCSPPYKAHAAESRMALSAGRSPIDLSP